MTPSIDQAVLVGLTDFGDLAVLLPLAALMLVWLLRRSWRCATWWVTAVGLCMGGIALLKIYFYACPLMPDLRSPSGHTSFSTLIYGAFAMIAAVRTAGWRRVAAIGIGVVLVAGIAVTRVILGAHSVLETGLGLVIGAAALAVFGFGYLRRQPPDLSLPLLLAATAVLIALFRGEELHAEEVLRAINLYLHIGAACI